MNLSLLTFIKHTKILQQQQKIEIPTRIEDADRPHQKQLTNMKNKSKINIYIKLCP